MNKGPFTTYSTEETLAAAGKLGRSLRGGELLLFRGDLGAGKTTFIRGLAQGLNIYDPTSVSSPSYTLINEYEGRIRLIHADLYRLSTPEEIEDLDLLEMLDEHTVMAIEWSERMEKGFFQPTHTVELTYLSDSERQISITCHG